MECRKGSHDFVMMSQWCDRQSQMVTSWVTVTVCHMTRVTWGPWESKCIATVVKCISSRELSENSIKFSLSNSEQRDSWLNSGHQTLDANTVGSRIVFKEKLDGYGKHVKFKARIVAQGGHSFTYIGITILPFFEILDQGSRWLINLLIIVILSKDEKIMGELLTSSQLIYRWSQDVSWEESNSPTSNSTAGQFPWRSNPFYVSINRFVVIWCEHHYY